MPKITAEKLFQARFDWEVLGHKQLEACKRAGFTAQSLAMHSRTNSKVYQESSRLIEQAVDEQVMAVAKARLLRILRFGTDGPSAMLISRVLGLREISEHIKTKEVETVEIPIFGETDALNHLNGSRSEARDKQPAT